MDLKECHDAEPKSSKILFKKTQEVAMFFSKLSLTMDGWVKGPWRNLKGDTPP